MDMKAAKILMTMNKCFRAPTHPFNLKNEGIMSYAEWQYEKGEDTIKFYLNFTSTDKMFLKKTVLDVGCGEAGKTLYYASMGVKEIFGLEILEKYRRGAEGLAEKKGLSEKFRYICRDASDTKLASGSIDTVIMNDAMEHVSDPEGVLRECARILKPGGRLYVNFPPYHHPFGAHLSDAIYIPWVHLIFGEKTLISAYKQLVEGLPDGRERVEFRISADDNGKEYFSYINKMTIKKFKAIVKGLPSGLKLVYYKEEPLRGFLSGMAKAPLLREMLVKMVVAVFEKK